MDCGDHGDSVVNMFPGWGFTSCLCPVFYKPLVLVFWDFPLHILVYSQTPKICIFYWRDSLDFLLCVCVFTWLCTAMVLHHIQVSLTLCRIVLIVTSYALVCTGHLCLGLPLTVTLSPVYESEGVCARVCAGMCMCARVRVQEWACLCDGQRVCVIQRERVSVCVWQSVCVCQIECVYDLLSACEMMGLFSGPGSRFGLVWFQ